MSDRVQRRARRLTALYPRAWRERYGEEFEQLLADEMRDRRHCPRRVVDVTAHALLAHLTAGGLVGPELTSWHRWRALRLLAVVIGAFFTLAVGLWSQVTVGWAWATPAAPDARVALTVMSGALIGLAAIAVMSVLVVLAGLACSARGRSALRLWPLLVSVIGGLALWLACRHIGSQWPDADRPDWSRHSIVPGGLARLGWAATLFISADWTHPAALVARRPDVLAWMVVSPALLVAITGAAGVGLRRATLPTPVINALAALAAAGVGLAALCVAGAAAWILSPGPGPGQMFTPGSIDDLGLGVLAAALLVAGQLTRRVLSAVRAPLDA